MNNLIISSNEYVSDGEKENRFLKLKLFRSLLFFSFHVLMYKDITKISLHVSEI